MVGRVIYFPGIPTAVLGFRGKSLQNSIAKGTLLVDEGSNLLRSRGAQN